MTVQQNIATATAARAELLAHCMVADLQEDDAHVMVVYPYNVEGLDGVRVAIGKGGKTAAYNELLKRSEAAWQASLWWKQ